MTIFDRLNPFRKPTAKELVENNLEEYQRQLVIQEAAASYHYKMVSFYSDGITRLKGHTN